MLMKNVKTIIQPYTGKNEDAWRSTKKVGLLMGDKEDVERRKQLSPYTN